MKKLTLAFLASVGAVSAMDGIKNTFIENGPINKNYQFKYEKHREDTRKKFEDFLRLKINQLERLIKKRSISNTYSAKVIESQEELNNAINASEDLENIILNINVASRNVVADYRHTQSFKNNIADMLNNKVEDSHFVAKLCHEKIGNGAENNGDLINNVQIDDQTADNNDPQVAGFRNKQIQAWVAGHNAGRKTISNVFLSRDVMDILQVMDTKNGDYSEKEKNLLENIKNAFIDAAGFSEDHTRHAYIVRIEE
jgi:hypothetical protein